MKILSDFIIKPIISEKSFSEAKSSNKYTFVVAKAANKTDIKNAVEKLFKVDVRKVYTANIKKQKTKQTRQGKQITNNSYKKARVKLAKGQKIEMFEEKADGKKKKKD